MPNSALSLAIIVKILIPAWASTFVTWLKAPFVFAVKSETCFSIHTPPAIFYISTRSASSKSKASVFSQPRQGSVMDLPKTPPLTSWLPSSK